MIADKTPPYCFERCDIDKIKILSNGRLYDNSISRCSIKKVIGRLNSG